MCTLCTGYLKKIHQHGNLWPGCSSTDGLARTQCGSRLPNIEDNTLCESKQLTLN